jgi:hypothetical protein
MMNNLGWTKRGTVKRYTDTGDNENSSELFPGKSFRTTLEAEDLRWWGVPD